MTPDLTDTLCTRCGLCCDGTLFADVELSGLAEVSRLEVLGLEVEDDSRMGGLLVQPCAALSGTRCSVYAHRPKCCRTFECSLLEDARSGVVGVEQAAGHIRATLERIHRVRRLLRRLGSPDVRLPLAERVAETLSDEGGATAGSRSARAELLAETTALESVIRTTFLRPTR